MRIALVSSRESVMNLMPGLEKFLNGQIINVEVESFLLPMNLDIIKKIAELEDYDLIFVHVLYEKEDAKIKILMEKIVGLEVEKKLNIIKAIERSDLEEGIESVRINDEKDPEVIRWGSFILKELFGEEGEEN